MSKRGMEMQGGSERYGGAGGTETPADTPTKATAAQLARRKIANLKGPRSSRSASPTKSTPAPSFGGFGQDQQQQQQPQQSGGGFTFGQSAPAPQQTNPFGRSQASTNGGFSFGQQTEGGSFTFGQSQPNSSFSFGGAQTSASFPPADGNNQMNSNNNNQFSFGASQPASQSGFSGSIFNFGGSNSASQPASQTFGNNDSGMMDASDNTTPTSTQSEAAATSAPSSTPFGQQTPAASNPFASLARNPSNDAQSTGGFTFGQKPAASPAPAQEKTTQSPATNLFSFGSKPAGQASSPQPSSSNLFDFGSKSADSQPSPAFTSPCAQTTSSSSIFSKPSESQQTPSQKPAFGGFGSSPKPAETPQAATQEKPSSSIFGFPNKQAETLQATAQDKPSSSIFKFQPKATESTVNSTPKPAPTATSGGFSFTPKPAASQQSSEESTPKPASNGFNFSQKSTETQKTPAQSTAAPASNAFSFSASASAPSNIFAQSAQKPTQNGAASPAPSKPTQPQTHVFASSANAFSTASTQAAKSTDNTSKISELNKALLQHLQSSPLDHDWSAPLSYYMTQCRKIKASLTDSLESATSEKHAREEQEETAAPPAKKAAFSASSASPQKPLSATASLFNNILDSPQQPQAKSSSETTSSVSAPFSGVASPLKPANNVNLNASASAPSASSVPKFGNGKVAAPADFFAAFSKQAKAKEEEEKQKRKAEDFDSDEDDEEEWQKRDQEKQEAKRKALLQQSSKKVLKNVGGQFVLVDAEEDVQSNAASAASPATNSSVFDTNGSDKSTTNASNPFAHLSQASASGKDEADDEDTDEEEKDDEGASSEVNKAGSATPAKSGGLFGRVGPQNATSQTPQFSFGNSVFGKSTSGQDGDQTWKPESPIKFGNTGTTTPEGSPAKPAALFQFGGPSTNGTTSEKPSENKPFSGLFGAKPTDQKSSSPAPSIFANLNNAAPSSSGKGGVGFQFGGPGASSIFSGAASPTTQSQDASRATTPGAVTGDDASTTAGTENDADGDAAPPEEQRDLTSLTVEERKTEEVLFEQKSRCKKFVKGDAEPWQNKGVGIIRLLKNKETGNVRVLMRQDPNGTIMVNANIIKNKVMYSAIGEKQVKMVFAEKDGLSTFSMGFGSKEKAAELLGAVIGQIE